MTGFVELLFNLIEGYPMEAENAVFVKDAECYMRSTGFGNCIKLLVIEIDPTRLSFFENQK